MLPVLNRQEYFFQQQIASMSIYKEHSQTNLLAVDVCNNSRLRFPLAVSQMIAKLATVTAI